MSSLGVRFKIAVSMEMILHSIHSMFLLYHQCTDSLCMLTTYIIICKVLQGYMDLNYKTNKTFDMFVDLIKNKVKNQKSS